MKIANSAIFIVLLLVSILASFVTGCERIQSSTVDVQPTLDDIPTLPPAAAGQFRIVGTVRNANLGLVAATIRVEPNAGSVFTPDGKYTLDVAIREGSYRVIATTPDGRSEGDALIQTAKGDQRADIIVRQISDVGFVITVLGAQRAPLSDAVVRFADDARSALTDPNGVAVIKGGDLMAGQIYELIVEHPLFTLGRIQARALAGLTQVVIVLKPI